MNETVVAYIEPTLRWGPLSRYRPESGLAFEKHVWLFPLQGQPPKPGELLFERVGEIVVRDRISCREDGYRVPLAQLVDESNVPSLARVALSGSGVPRLLTSLLQKEDAVVPSASLTPEQGNSGVMVTLESLQPGLLRLPPDQVQLAYDYLIQDPQTYLLASPGLPMPLKHLRSLKDLCLGSVVGALPFAEFADLVMSCRWVATSFGQHAWIKGIVLYGGSDLILQIKRTAAECEVTVHQLEDPRTALLERKLVDLPLPSWDELPLAEGEDRIDVGGYNLALLPVEGEATALVLDDTAVVDLEPLQGWQQLTDVSLRCLRPLSLAPLKGVQRLWLGPVEHELLNDLADFETLEELRLEGTPLHDLAKLASCQELRVLELRYVPLETLQGIERIGSLTHISIAAASVPSEMSYLVGLTALQELCIHVAQGFDLRSIPALPQLERLEICGLDDRSIEIEGIEALGRFPALRSLALRTTNVTGLEELEGLGELKTLDLAATDIVDLSPLRNSQHLQDLDLTLVPASDLSPLAELPSLQVLHLSDVEASVDCRMLSSLSQLKELHLRNCVDMQGEEALGQLSQLQVLDLSWSLFKALESLRGLSSLRGLNLSGIETEDFSALSSLSALRSLTVVGCRLSDLRPLQGLVALREVFLDSTGVSDVSPLAHCDCLTRLSLAGLTIADLGPLVNLEHLHWLDLQEAVIGELGPLEELSQLRTLNLSGSTFASLAPIRTLQRLRELRARCLVKGVDLTPLLDLPPLAVLELSRVNLDRELEAQLSTRHHLILSGE